MKEYKIKLPIYKGTFRVIFSNNFKETFDKLKISNKEDWELDSLHGMFINSKNGSEFIVLYTETTTTHNTIAHELAHATSYILTNRGYKLDDSNDEPFAYLCGYLTEHVYKAVEKFNIKVNNKQ